MRYLPFDAHSFTAPDFQRTDPFWHYDFHYTIKIGRLFAKVKFSGRKERVFIIDKHFEAQSPFQKCHILNSALETYNTLFWCAMWSRYILYMYSPYMVHTLHKWQPSSFDISYIMQSWTKMYTFSRFNTKKNVISSI